MRIPISLSSSITSESKGKKKSARSKFLSAFMSNLGADVISAFDASDVDKFRSSMDKLVNSMAEKMGDA